MRIPTAIALLLALQSADLSAAPPDPAEMFPADTPLFIEVRRPGDIAQELAAIMKGTILEDSLVGINKLREKNKEQPYVDTYQLGLLGTMLGPEMLAEAKRFGSFAFGVTGYGKDKGAEFAGVLLTGDSQLPGLAMRMMLSTQGDIKKVATVEGIDIYQETLNPYGVENGPFFPGGPFAPPGVNRGGDLYAYSPGRVFFGSSKEALTSVIRRWKGTEKSSSLATAPAFVEARALRESSAIFAFSDPKTLLHQAELQARARGRDAAPLAWALVKGLINPDAVRSAAIGLTPENGAYRAELQVRLDDSKSSPLFDLISSAKLSFRPPTLAVNGGLMLSVALRDGGKGGEQLLRLADAATKATGTLGITPSEAVQELQEKAKVPGAADILSKLRGVSVLLPPVRDWLRGGFPWPTLVLHGGDAATASAAETALPALLKLLGVESIEPTVEAIGEQKVRSIATNGPPGPTAIHYSTRGNAFAVGADRNLVASALNGANTQSPELEASAKDACLIAVCSWGPMLPPLLGIAPPPDEPVKEKPRKAAAKEEPAPQPVDVDVRAKARHAFDDAIRSFDSAPPFVLTIRRDQNLVQVTVRQPDSRVTLRKFVDKSVEWLNRSAEAGMNFPHFPIGGFGILQ